MTRNERHTTSAANSASRLSDAVLSRSLIPLNRHPALHGYPTQPPYFYAIGPDKIQVQPVASTSSGMSAHSQVGGGRRPPRSIRQIADTAADFVYDPTVQFKNWLRAARSLRQQAEIYENEGDLERAYELYFRQVLLVLEFLPSHPQSKVGGNRALYNAATKDANISLNRCEALKPYIKAAYDEWENRRKAREAQAIIAQSQRRAESQGQSRPGSSGSYSRLSGDYGGARVEEYSGQHHQDVALEIARREQRSGYQRRPQRRADEGASLSQQMQGLRLQLDGKQQPFTRSTARVDDRSDSRANWAYPSVPESRPLAPAAQQELWLSGLGQQSRSQDGGHPEPLTIKSPIRGPTLPGKEPLNSMAPPARPPKDSGILFPSSGPVSQSAPQLPPKAIAPTTNHPETRTFKPAAYLENGQPLRTVFLPPQMRQDFLRRAQQNTSRNLETCGILCGTLKSNALFIERLVIPEQESTSDTCEMTDEGEIALFDYCEKEDLLTLGWIHTHPTQTCFMSSRDLHTHCGYQAMMAESIAIVCAPSLNEWGAFRLTDPPGMKCIQTCKKPGIFHPHDVDRIYTEATRPGHVVLLEGLQFDTHDMRKR